MPQATRPRKAVKPVQGKCSWLLQPGDGRHPHPGVLSINGTAYSFEPVLDGLSLLGFRLTKKDGRSYDVDVSEDPWRCDCGDYEFNRAHAPTAALRVCKHVAATRAALAAIDALPVVPQAPAPLEPGDPLPEPFGTDGDPFAYTRP